ncbi:C2H2-type domain-containing protein [Raphanus sativus]|nr:C2H2-type domain-containing protein [Raphanus sativus]KAJ4874199.1 C2H2-type domain-containing protein [Raphanus sativus]
MFHFWSFDVFISHLKSRQHKKELLLSVIPFDINNYPDNTCTHFEYPYYNDANRKLHLESDEHKEAAASVSHEKASLVDPLNTRQEKEDANGKRTSEEPLLYDS